MRARCLCLLVVFVILPLLSSPTVAASQATQETDTGCNVTLPNGQAPPDEEALEGWYGSGDASASLWLLMTWDDGFFTPQPPAPSENREGHPVKFAFFRGEGSGDISVTVTDSDGQQLPAGTITPPTDDPYPIPGMFALGGMVPTLGCWTFTATDGNDTLTWTMEAVSTFGDCDVTEANGEEPPAETGDHWYGSGAPEASLWVQLPTQPIVPTPHFEPSYEGGHGIKTPFWRGEGSGPITLTGDRLDEPSDLEPTIDAAWDGYPVPGFIATGIWYPTYGCWKLTATDGNDAITWTVLVESPFAHCPVTSGAGDDGMIPDGVADAVLTGDPGTPTTVVSADPDHFYGESGLYVSLGDPGRTVWTYPVDSERVSDDGAITDPKRFWYRQGDAEGELSITVRNTDLWFREEPEITIPEGYGTSGLQIAGITFPGPGCWEVTGTSGDISITYTVRLEIVPAEG